MSTATSRKRKAMRVATVFTGAAATAVAFAPAALAVPGHAPAQGHTALVNGNTRAVRSDIHSGSIRSAGCNTTDAHWLHLEYASVFRSKLCKAFGFQGYMTDTQDMYAECGGNNHGNIYYSKGRDLAFGPGNTYRSVTRRIISAVSIYSWKGTDQCAWPR